MVLADRVFVFGPRADAKHVDVGETRTVVTSVFSELVDFVNPTGSVTIRTQGGRAQHRGQRAAGLCACRSMPAPVTTRFNPVRRWWRW